MGENDRSVWDDRKNDRDILRHGIDFAGLGDAFDGRFILFREDRRRDYGEARFNALGERSGIVLNITPTPRGGKARIVSARIAAEDPDNPATLSDEEWADAFVGLSGIEVGTAIGRRSERCARDSTATWSRSSSAAGAATRIA